MAGYPLKIASAACMGALSCGPGTSPTGGGGSGSSSTGFDLTGSTTQTTQTSTSTSTSTTAVDDGTTDAAESSSTGSADETGSSGSTGEEPEVCPNPGQVCEEFLLCQCSCDTDPDCCTCQPVPCTEDGHCADDEICGTPIAFDPICLPGACAGSSFDEVFIQTNQDVIDASGQACLSGLYGQMGTVTDLSPLAGLSYIHHTFSLETCDMLGTLTGLESLQSVETLILSENATLSSLDGLSGLQTIVDFGLIQHNPMLDRAEIDAFLAGIDGGDQVMVCGNLNDVPC